MKRHLLITGIISAIGLLSCSGGISSSSGSDTELRGLITAGPKDAIAKTASGRVAGYIEDGIYTFKGIPYAKGERFMPPAKPDSWEGIRSSRAYGPTCPQPFRTGWLIDEMAFQSNWDDGVPGEDCLRVNIWTPQLKDNKKRPVMVWLHGGGFSAGSGQELPAYDGTNLARKGDVVVVSLNHRLNVLGFLDLSAFGDKYAHSGNVGLLDLVAALEWVKDNITEFGGDPSNVTIFGQSGGGGKVTALMATPSARGLFHKAIVQSGSINRIMESRYSRRIGAALVEELGLNASQIDQLKEMPYERLLAAGEKAMARVKEESRKNGFNIFLFNWSPTVDGKIIPEQPFDGKAPDISRDVPMIVGTTLHEFMSGSWNPALKNADKATARTELEKRYGEKASEFIDAFGKAYPGYKNVDLFDVDFDFRPEALRQAAYKSGQRGAPVYMYLFNWESPVMDYAFRSSHCMELPFVFDNIYRARHQTGGGAEAHRLADKMSRAWINFAYSGNPSTEDLPEWPAYEPNTGATMIFDNTCEIKYNHDKELMEIIQAMSFTGL